MESRYLNARQIANYLNLSEATIRSWVRLGNVPYSKFGRAVRFDIREIDKWVKQKTVTKHSQDFHLDAGNSLL